MTIGIERGLEARARQSARPSIACWRDHSIGASRNRVTPMPRGSRPSIAAFTGRGERKASDSVILTWRTLQFSRLAMLSTLAFASSMSSLSQRRPLRSMRPRWRGSPNGSGEPAGCRQAQEAHGGASRIFFAKG